MLSIIICSIKPHLLQQLNDNIERSIGVPYEILFWDNRIENKGICEVYNNLAIKAKFPFLCFCHEDILFETNEWGNELVRIFNEHSTPVLVGIGGSKYKSKNFSGWYTGQKGIDFFYYTNLVDNKKKEIIYPTKWNKTEVDVVCIDGVFMACSKQLWEEVKFNHNQLKGFHFYDLDFSLRASHQFEVIVTQSIQIIHLSLSGDFGEKWVEDAFVFHDYMNHKLPITNCMDKPDGMDEKIVNVWLDRLKNEKINFQTRLKWITKQQLYKKIIHWPYLIKFLSYYSIGFGKLINFLKFK